MGGGGLLAATREGRPSPSLGLRPDEFGEGNFLGDARERRIYTKSLLSSWIKSYRAKLKAFS